MINLFNRKPLKPFVPFQLYNLSGGDPQRTLVDIIVEEMEKKIEVILKEKEKEEAEATVSRYSEETGTYTPGVPNYLWLMDCRLKERKTLSNKECSVIADLVEKTNMSEWAMILELWGNELDIATTRSEVIKSFENAVKSVMGKRDMDKTMSASVDDVVISMKQLLNNEEKEVDIDNSSTSTVETIISFDTLQTSNDESIQLHPDAKDKYKRVLDIV